MAGWFPAPGWPVWDAMESAGLRVTSDPRSLAPPVVLCEVASQGVTGSAGAGCLVVEGVCRVVGLAPAPDNGDSRRWLWETFAPVVIPFAAGDAAAVAEDEMPGVEMMIPFTYTIGDQ